MSKNTSITLGEHFTDFVEGQLARGPLRLGKRGCPRRAALARRTGNQACRAESRVDRGRTEWFVHTL